MELVGCGRGAVEVQRAGDSYAPTVLAEEQHGIGRGGVAARDVEERNVEPALGGGPGLSAGGGRGAQLDAETDDDRRLLGLEHDGDREVGVVVGEDRQPHDSLVVALHRTVVEHGVQERDESLALVVVGQHIAEPGCGIAEPPGICRAILDDAERGGEIAQHAEVGSGEAHFSSGPSRWRAYGTRSRPSSSATMLPGIS